MLMSSPNPVNPGDSLDSPLNVPPTGTLHGAEFDTWTVYDAVGATIATQTQVGDVSYGFINYVDKSLAGATNFANPNSTIIPALFTADYFGRANNNSGWVASDWIASSGINGNVPTWSLGGKSNTIPSTAGNRPLNNIGGPNFDASLPPVVTTAQATINYPIGSGPVVIDSVVTVTDVDSFFLGSAQVAITSGFNAPTDSLAFAGTPTITGSYNAATGILTLTGDDTFANWNAALQSVTFDYSGSVVGNPPTRTITFQAIDGTVASDPTNSVDFINIQGPVANPPIVTGTSTTPVAWTEVLPPDAPQVVVVAPGLTISDASTSQLTSATVGISANFASGQDSLAWNATIATANNITVTASSQNRTLTLTPTAPDTSESLAAFQAVLQTVTYSNSSKNPSTASRTITFTVVDSNSIASGVNAPNAAQQIVTVTAVNNPPTATSSAGDDSYTVGNAAILVDSAISISDPDSATLTGATVSITGGFSPGDTLSFVNQAGIIGSYNAASGVLTLTGAAVPIDYQVALRAVTFSNASAAASGVTRTISFQASDGQLGNVATKQIAVQRNLVRGDFNLNGHATEEDIPVMLSALTDLNSFQSMHFLSNSDLLAICDVNQDTFINNRDIQAMLDLIAGGGSGSGASESGSGSVATAATSTVSLTITPLLVTQPANVSASSLSAASSSSGLPLAPFAVSAKPLTVQKLVVNHTAVPTAVSAAQLPTGLPKNSGHISGFVGPLPKSLQASAVDQALCASPMYRSRHLRWFSESPPASGDDFFATLG